MISATKNSGNENGVAIVTVLLLTVLCLSIVTSLFWEQQVQVRSIENQRLQLQQHWILKGALDWAKLILLEDAKFSTTDDLSEPWNTPLMDTRLDRYVKDSKVQSPAVNAVLSGVISDAQGKFNARRLASNGQVITEEVNIFARLLKQLKISQKLASTIAKELAKQQQQFVRSDKYISGQIGFETLSDFLALKSFNAEILTILENHVILLPKQTKTNVNTASMEVIAAELDIPYTDARNVLAIRDNAIFLDTADFLNRIRQVGVNANVKNITVKTDFFLITGTVKINQSLIRKKCLIQRSPQGVELVWLKDF
ncbi:MAG: general secretion pathway protein GspK [Proteobacteria bacterium]|nr:general secretion pathway protein GspK [Pseudomonadota bacterium]